MFKIISFTVLALECPHMKKQGTNDIVRIIPANAVNNSGNFFDRRGRTKKSLCSALIIDRKDQTALGRSSITSGSTYFLVEGLDGCRQS